MFFFRQKQKTLSKAEIQHLRRRGLNVPPARTKRDWLSKAFSWWENTSAEKFLENLEQHLRELAVLSLLALVTNATIIFGFWSWIFGNDDRLKQKHFQAWQVINSAIGEKTEGGRRDAIDDLYEDGIPLTGLNLKGAFLPGLQLPTKCFSLWRWFEVPAFFCKKFSFLTVSLEAKLSEADFQEARLSRANFQGADLSDANFQGADLSGAQFQRANLSRANFQQSKTILLEANFQKARLLETEFPNAILSETDFRTAELSDSNFQGAILLDSNFQEAALSNSNFQRAELLRANFRSADLSNVNFQRAHLSNSTFQRAILLDSNFQGADLSNVNFQGAKLQGINLQKANLSGVNFQGAELLQTNLSQANLSGIDFRNARLREHRYEEAIFCETIMPDGVKDNSGCDRLEGWKQNASEEMQQQRLVDDLLEEPLEEPFKDLEERRRLLEKPETESQP